MPRAATELGSLGGAWNPAPIESGRPLGTGRFSAPFDEFGLAYLSLSEGLVEGDLSTDRDLVGRDAALEEVRELLDILKVHEAEGVLGSVPLG